MRSRAVSATAAKVSAKVSRGPPVPFGSRLASPPCGSRAVRASGVRSRSGVSKVSDIEGDPLLRGPRLVGELPYMRCQRFAAAGQPGLDGPGRCAGLGADLLDAQVLQVEQHQGP